MAQTSPPITREIDSFEFYNSQFSLLGNLRDRRDLGDLDPLLTRLVVRRELGVDLAQATLALLLGLDTVFHLGVGLFARRAPGIVEEQRDFLERQAARVDQVEVEVDDVGDVDRDVDEVVLPSGMLAKKGRRKKGGVVAPHSGPADFDSLDVLQRDGVDELVERVGADLARSEERETLGTQAEREDLGGVVEL